MEWINIKDELPHIEDGKITSDVCIVWGYNEYEEEWCCFFGRYWNDQGWFTNDNDLPINKPTHWMLITQPNQ